MVANEVILLEDMLERSRPETRVLLSDTDHHTYFTAKHYMSSLSPTHDDLLSGLVDGGGDGGIDAAYIYCDGFCIRDDEPIGRLGRQSQIELILLQVKNTSGFTEQPIDKLLINLPLLLDLGRDERAMTQFNPKVLEVTRRFLNLYREAIMPSLSIYVCFASLRAEYLHPNIETHGSRLESVVESLFASSRVSVGFLDAGELADLARQPLQVTRTLTLTENAISTDVAGGYIGLVSLRELERFITNEQGQLDASVFEANVRDYEGVTDVNKSIQNTLQQTEPDVDFWWLNNGITIVASRVQSKGTAKLFELDSPQIVNGLQTCHEIYKRRRLDTEPEDTRSVLVKIIQVSDNTVRDRIIRATNSQTNLGLSSLRATDKVQRQIEEYLRSSELYYERRRNLYANRGMPLEKLVSIDQMGQALLSVLAQAPHTARSGASKIFDNEVYEVLFDSEYPLGTYLTAIRILRHCEEYLRSSVTTRADVENLAFHLAMAVSIFETRRDSPTAVQLSKSIVRPSSTVMRDLLLMIRSEYAAATRLEGETLYERLSKNPRVTMKLKQRALQYAKSAAARGGSR